MESKKETAAGLESGVTTAERSNLLGSAAPIVDKGGRQERDAKKTETATTVKKKRHPAVRALRWTLLKSIVPILCVVAVLGGMYIGYAVLGKQPAGEVFKVETWKHMYDLIFADS